MLEEDEVQKKYKDKLSILITDFISFYDSSLDLDYPFIF
jgi:hypothetical protein